MTKKVFLLAYMEKKYYLCTRLECKFVSIMYKTIQKMFALALLAVTAVGCVTQKQMTYLSDARPEMADSINASFKPQSEMIIRSGDALTIFVSALDLEAVTPYNLPMVVFAKPGEQQLSTTPALQYYIVDDEGNIDFPVLGKLHVAGMRRNEVEEYVKQQLSSQVLNPLVHVNLVNAKVSVMGEVARPGQVALTSGRMTILEALAAAGDLTSYGRRDNVLLTREVDGKIEIARLNLRSTDLYTSPYYYVQQNDVIYVSPNKVRAVASTNSGLWLSVVSTALSAATVIITVVK